MDALFPPHKILHTQVVQEREWMAHPITLQSKVVCDPCNSGWMSALETDARPSLVRMMMGEGPLRVPGQAARIIALWSVKTSMMFHSTMPATPVIPPQHHHEVFKTRLPPRQTWVFIGRYTGEEFRMGRYHMRPLAFALGPNDGGGVRPNGYSVTLIIGHFIAQVIGILAEKRVTIDIPTGFPLLSIWPALPWNVLGRRNRVDDRTLTHVENAIVFRDPSEWGVLDYPHNTYGSYGWD
jgi:hypothetical protein